MKSGIYKYFFGLFLSVAIAGVASAQYDDIYFDPNNADEAYAAVELEKYYDESDYEGKDIEDDYDYYYSSRIKRFNNPYYGFDFYSPAYVNPAYYNPYYAGYGAPGSSIYWGGPVPAQTSAFAGSGVYVSSGYGYGGGFNNPAVYSGGGFYGTTYPSTYGGPIGPVPCRLK